MAEVLLAKYLGKKRVIAETGAGQHGVALATAAAYFGLECEISLGTWQVGIYGGYAVKVNRKPWIWSDGNRITTDNEIRLKPFTAGISVSFHGR